MCKFTMWLCAKFLWLHLWRIDVMFASCINCIDIEIKGLQVPFDCSAHKFFRLLRCVCCRRIIVIYATVTSSVFVLNNYRCICYVDNLHFWLTSSLIWYRFVTNYMYLLSTVHDVVFSNLYIMRQQHMRCT